MEKKIKISLIQYNAGLSKDRMPPLGILYLSSYLKKHGYKDISVVDLLLFKNQKRTLIKYLKNLNPKDNNLIGFYMNSHTRFIVKKAIETA